MALPQTRTAVVADGNGSAKLSTLPVVAPKAGELLVQVHATALNPVDWKLLERATKADAVLDKDYAGIVIALGPETAGWAVGDRIAGIAMGGLSNPLSAGGAATYATVEADLAWHVPSNISLEEATTYGIGGTTAALALYFILGNPAPPNTPGEGKWALISGGSTQVGLHFVQLARLAGYKVVATASEKNFDLMKSYGADKVVSYADHEAAIAEISPLKPAFVAELAGGSSWELSRALVTPGARYCAVLEDPKGQVEHVNYGRAFNPNASFDPKVREWAIGWYKRLPELVKAGQVRPSPITVREGLEGVPDGLKELRAGKVSASKLVFRVTKEA